MNSQKGVIHLLLPLVLLLIVGAGVFVALILLGVAKNPLSSLPGIGKQTPKVSVKSEYKNPFDKKTQYVNPFETYKNPFVVNK